MHHNGHRPKIVVIGGGTGISNILQGLKRYPADLTAIVTMFDNGGSSGLLRKEFGFLPFGDLRQCILALGSNGQETEVIRQALEFRFGDKTSLNGHSVGNLFLAALTSVSGDLEQAIADIGQILNVSGQVIPVTLEHSELCAELEGSQIIQGESNIDTRATPLPRIKKIFLNPEVGANPKAIQAVLEADTLVFGPGDLYTSILPNLLAKGMVEAIDACQATRLYVCNLMTKPGETDGFKASDFIIEVSNYLSPGKVDWALVNTATPTPDVLQAYETENACIVEPDLDVVSKYVYGTISKGFALIEVPLRHDPDSTADAIFQASNVGRLSGMDVKR